MVDAFHNVADICLPKQEVKAKRPWISKRTLNLVEKRVSARKNAAFDEEKAWAKEVKKSVAHDRKVWLEDLLCTGIGNKYEN